MVNIIHNFEVADAQWPAPLGALADAYRREVLSGKASSPAALLARAEAAGFTQDFFTHACGAEAKTFGGHSGWGASHHTDKGTIGGEVSEVGEEAGEAPFH